MKYTVSAFGTEQLDSVEIEANSKEEAAEKYQEMWEAGNILALDYEIDHFTVTDENGKDTEIK